MAWVGRHLGRGVIAVDLYGDDPIPAAVMEDLRHVARKLTAGLTTRGTSLRLESFLDLDRNENVLIGGLRDQVGARAVALDLETDGHHGDDLPLVAEEEWGPPLIESPWPGKGTTLDVDADAWGMTEARTESDYLLRVPVRFGTKVVAHITMAWPADSERVRGCVDQATTRAERVRDTLAAWSFWSAAIDERDRPDVTDPVEIGRRQQRSEVSACNA